MLVDAIAAESGVRYKFTYISPLHNHDGGQPNGNIRNVFMYNPKYVTLTAGTPGDASTHARVVEYDKYGYPILNYNPVRIVEPAQSLMRTRKPLVASFDVHISSNETWDTKDAHALKDKDIETVRVYAISVHLSSKWGSSPFYGSIQAPINGRIERRKAQLMAVSSFIDTLRSAISKPPASDRPPIIAVMGDYNEYSETLVQPFADMNGLTNAVPAMQDSKERYSYIYNGSAQELDHVVVSDWLFDQGRLRTAAVAHVNTWIGPGEHSDHDPVAVIIDGRGLGH